MGEVVFNINGNRYVVNSKVDPSTSLNDYIRNVVNLRGTKAMCHEGGCGVCVVAIRSQHPLTKMDQILSVNSCLVPILSCHGWEITTVEGIGNRRDGYHAIQTRLAGFNGTQCGYCTPGWVMNMYSIFEGSKRQLTMKAIENSFASNICRCTGYRPILDAFKSLGMDSDPKLQNQLNDIEDLSGIKMCRKSGHCSRSCCKDENQEFCFVGLETFGIFDNKEIIELPMDGVKWYKVFELDQIFNVFDKEGTSSYMLVTGNTGQGVYHVKNYPKIMIDISSVEALKKTSLESNLILGGGMTLTEVMLTFKEISKSNEYFRYLQQLYNHLDLVAHLPVRNIGTIAGNLYLKYLHNDFPSDVFLVLETVGAVITIDGGNGKKEEMSLLNFLRTDMKGKVILNIALPPLSEYYAVKTYKIMPRAQNSHAQVNAGFLLKFNKDRNSLEKATIVFGGIHPKFIHAASTESYLVGKDIFDSKVVQMTLSILSDELFPESTPPDPSPQFRKKVALGLLYKFILRICPKSKLDSRMITGGTGFKRALSRGQQNYDTKKSLWPLTKPIPKLEALIQCSGEAQFANDMPTIPGELFATFVLSAVCRGTIDHFDASEALNLKGVVALFTAKDIPGTNTFTPPVSPVFIDMEEILCSGTVKCHSQPIGIIVATTEKLANKAAKLVKVTYKDVPRTRPVLDITDARRAPGSENRILNVATVEPTAKGTDVTKVIKGNFEIYGQYQFTMEPQTCVCVPNEYGLDVFSATQYVNLVHISIALMLKIPQNQINMNVRRIGGGYGAKVSKASQIACACALAAKLLNRPVRFILSLETNMNAIGKRIPVTADYEVGVNDKGEIQYLKNYFFHDNGISNNESSGTMAMEAFLNCYKTDSWFISSSNVLTDTISNTWCRAPGTAEGISSIENIMEHIACVTGLDPIAVRNANMSMTDNPIPSLIGLIQQSSDYSERLQSVKDFNKANRWKKRGISLVPMKFPLALFGNFSVLLAVYQADGTVSVTHGGIEMGQGLNTKVAQVCAHILGVPLESISIKPTTNLTAPNSMASVGSFASESCCYAAMKACQDLLDRMEPIKKTMKNPTWQQTVLQCYISGVDLTSKYMFNSTDVQPYTIWGVTVSEVEVDILSGNHQVLRVDIIEDVGESLSPEIDVGQIEGSFIMGLGYWTSEKLVYDKQTGELLTNRTWTYKPPGVKDIPVDFRVQFRRNSSNPAGVLRSKATGEPPLCMSVCVIQAIRNAVTSARKDAGINCNEWYDINCPYTNENILLAIDTNMDEYKLK